MKSMPYGLSMELPELEFKGLSHDALVAKYGSVFEKYIAAKMHKLNFCAHDKILFDSFADKGNFIMTAYTRLS